MTQILPCRTLISDRFPVASFVVQLSPMRVFEVACTTDPTLFSPGQRHRRSARNFFTSRREGLMRAPAGEATWLLPSDQLQRFAGAQRIYYAIASYGYAYYVGGAVALVGAVCAVAIRPMVRGDVEATEGSLATT